MIRKAALHNLGCKVNAYETEAMRQLLEKAGYEIVPFEEAADVYVINTCSVTNIAEKKSRQMLHRARKQNPEAVVAAVGCYVQVAADRLKEDKAVDLIIGTNQKSQLVRALEEYFQERDRKGSREQESFRKEDESVPDAARPAEKSEPETFKYVRQFSQIRRYENLSIEKVSDHVRAFIKIQDGCNQFCSYCIIPYARGRVRSRDFGEILREAETLVQSGFQEIVLTGIHISSYGADMPEAERTSLLELVERLDELPGLKRLRLGSLEPSIITEEFAGRLSRLKTICPHFHLSLQSGSDTVLERMNRRYTAGQYLEGCGILRKWFDNPAITTDVIVGFPGETEKEFAETEAFIKQVQFYELHVFPYSRREGTRAAAMPDQISEAVKKARCGRLLELDRVMSSDYRRSFLGRRVEVLMEEKIVLNGTEYLVGHTREYVKAAVPWEESMRGRMMPGVPDRMLNDEVMSLVRE